MRILGLNGVYMIAAYDCEGVCVCVCMRANY